MGLWDEWPDFMPDTEIVAQIENGLLTLGAATKLRNFAQYTWTHPQVVAQIYKNGSRVATLAIDSQNGNITLGSAIAVSQGDNIELRFNFMGRASDPFISKAIFMHSAFFTVPAGTSTITFDDQTNTTPVPLFNMAFGWDQNSYLKAGFSVSSDGGATQDMSCTTRLVPSASESSTEIDLDSASTQTHTSSFTRAVVPLACEIELFLRSATSGTRVEEKARLVLFEVDEIGSYPGSFPQSGTMLVQDKPQDSWAPRWARPA